MTVRDGVDEPRRVVQRDQWQFARREDSGQGEKTTDGESHWILSGARRPRDHSFALGRERAGPEVPNNRAIRLVDPSLAPVAERSKVPGALRGQLGTMRRCRFQKWVTIPELWCRIHALL